MPTPQQSSVRFLMVFLGANDARLPNTPGGPQQHVPLDEYKSNLRKIATHQCITAHKDVRIILVTPPPVDESMLREADKVRFPDIGDIKLRVASTTATYAQAVRDLGTELDLPVLDFWAAMLSPAGYSIPFDGRKDIPGSRDAPQNPTLQAFLHDGLHLSRSGFELLFNELIALIARKWPDQVPERLPFVLPAWDDEEAWRGDTSAQGRNML